VSLLDWVRRRTVIDDRLGELRYWRGQWTSRSAACLGQSSVEVHVPGNRDGLLAEARELLDSLELAYPQIRPQILAHFHEHYEPYAEMLAALPEHEATLVRSIRNPEDLWTHARLVEVLVNAYGNAGTVELRYDTDWDTEHRLGVTISGGVVTDFCASVGPWR
jgi:hypothetical protein